MSALDNRALKTVATGVVAIALFTASALSVMAAPAGRTVARTKAAMHAQTVKNAAVAKKGIGSKGIGSKAGIAAKRSVGPRKLAAETPTVLEEIVIDTTPAATVAAANPAFRKHFFRGQA